MHDIKYKTGETKRTKKCDKKNSLIEETKIF